jgi:hypothetical protein
METSVGDRCSAYNCLTGQSENGKRKEATFFCHFTVSFVATKFTMTPSPIPLHGKARSCLLYPTAAASAVRLSRRLSPALVGSGLDIPGRLSGPSLPLALLGHPFRGQNINLALLHT